jgi:hypothetical protein
MSNDISTSVRQLEHKLKSFKGQFTLTDAAAVMGSSLAQAKDALDVMMGKYVCRLAMTENGDLIYSFGDSLIRRGQKTFAERMDAVREWLWKAFTVFFKVWIAVTLVVYFVIFLIILIALIVAASQGGGRRRGSSIRLDGIFRMFFAIFQWRTATTMIGYQMDRQGYRYRSYQPRSAVLNEKKKNFIASVYDFVFGPPRVERDSLNDQKELAAFVRQKKGIISPAEIVMLTGRSIPDAEVFFSECLSCFNGDAKLSDHGVVVGQFDQMTRSLGELEGGTVEYYWDEYEADYEITGNTSSRNALIIFMGLFNWFFSSVFLTAAVQEAQSGFLDSNEKLIGILLGWLPFIFSLLFFGTPLARLYGIFKRRRRRRENNLRKRIMRVVFKQPAKGVTLEEVVAAVNAGPEQKLSAAQVQSVLESMMRDYHGEVQLDPDGGSRYAFPRMATEMETVERLRAGLTVDKDLGKIIYDSKS